MAGTKILSLARTCAATALALALASATIWGALALWYSLPAPCYLRGAISIAFLVLGLGSLPPLFRRRPLRRQIPFVAVLICLLLWWNTVQPIARDSWAADVARQTTGTLHGDLLTLSDVRSFARRSETDFTERWSVASYDLSKLRSLDLFMSYWAGPSIAHVILSFGFEGGQQLAWSVEVRRRQDAAFSPVGDLFKTNPLVIVAAEERDVVGVRSNIRGEDVQVYRLNTTPAAARAMLLQYVNDANELAEHPRFYNSITTNCTTVVFNMIRAVGDPLPLDWRLLLNGYLPEYAYDQGALDERSTMEELRSRSHISIAARRDNLSADFSQAIRAGVPVPQ